MAETRALPRTSDTEEVTELRRTPETWKEVRDSLRGVAPTILLGTSQRSIDRAAQRVQDAAEGRTRGTPNRTMIVVAAIPLIATVALSVVGLLMKQLRLPAIVLATAGLATGFFVLLWLPVTRVIERTLYESVRSVLEMMHLHGGGSGGQKNDSKLHEENKSTNKK
jgi:hypothetical protein